MEVTINEPKYSVTRISTETLKEVREIADKHETTVPKILDRMLYYYKLAEAFEEEKKS
jgi:peroxiredoxin